MPFNKNMVTGLPRLARLGEESGSGTSAASTGTRPECDAGGNAERASEGEMPY